MYDAIVVGARVAGSTTAMLLARRGHRVLLVDRARFPSDTLSTHFVHLSGVRQLHRWGLLDAVRATGAPPIRQLRLDFGPIVLHGAPAAAGDVEESFCPRRTVLDKLLLDAAAAAGVEVRDGFAVDELLRDDDRVVGIRGHDAAARPCTERAAVVIGADGRNSLVARLVAAPEYAATPPLTCAYYSYWSGIEAADAELYPREGRAIAAMPTNDGLTCVYVAAPRSEFHTFRRDVEGNVTATLALAPGLAERVAAGRREERFRGTADLPNFLRRPYGPGWALVGDAGCHKDPLPAHGISDALRDAELLVDAVHAGLSGAAPMHQALLEYHRTRDEAELPRYRFTLALAALAPPPPPLAELLGSLVADPAGTSRFLGIFAGTVPIADVVGPLLTAFSTCVVNLTGETPRAAASAAR
jgi:flavin-dependent dehydrogenase